MIIYFVLKKQVFSFWKISDSYDFTVGADNYSEIFAKLIELC